MTALADPLESIFLEESLHVGVLLFKSGMFFLQLSVFGLLVVRLNQLELVELLMQLLQHPVLLLYFCFLHLSQTFLFAQPASDESDGVAISGLKNGRLEASGGSPLLPPRAVLLRLFGLWLGLRVGLRGHRIPVAAYEFHLRFALYILKFIYYCISVELLHSCLVRTRERDQVYYSLV